MTVHLLLMLEFQLLPTLTNWSLTVAGVRLGEAHLNLIQHY